MRRLAVLPITLLAVLLLGACGVHNQKKAINDARIGLAATGVGLEAADQAATEYFEEFPSSDTEKYCEGEVTLFILDAVAVGLQGAADAVNLWETSLAVYLAKKDAGEDTDADWDTVLSSEAEWLKVAVDVIAVLDLGMQYMKLVGVKIPAPLDYAWSFLYGMTGRPAHGPPDVTWGELATGTCSQYVPGGD